MEKSKEVKLEIQINEDVASGQYINMAIVNHNDSEFVIDGIYVQPQAPKAQVKSRLITSPRHAKRMMILLQNNIASYEQKFGAIDLSEPTVSPVNGTPIH
ncbi:MAG: DUF3467 domain-containing protein [Desulfuromonadales bacterium]|nr:DUF3467 domain-containing protein [Desulfuromonadales bacterium]